MGSRREGQWAAGGKSEVKGEEWGAKGKGRRKRNGVKGGWSEGKRNRVEDRRDGVKREGWSDGGKGDGG